MVKRFVPPIRAGIGRARIPRTDTTPQAAFEKAIRSQMQDIVKNFIGWAKHMEAESATVLKEALEPTFEKSKEYVPKDTLALLNSAYLEQRVFRGRSIVEIGYSRGGTPNYGPKVHEDLEAFHKAPTQAKFLERPLTEDASKIREAIIDGMGVASGVK